MIERSWNLQVRDTHEGTIVEDMNMALASGPLVEVWGSKTIGDSLYEGNSTYVVDGEPPIMNGKFGEDLQTTPTMLFVRSGLPQGTHTLSITNVCVQVTLGYFIVQETGLATVTTSTTQATNSFQMGFSTTTTFSSPSTMSATTGIQFHFPPIP